MNDCKGCTWYKKCADKGRICLLYEDKDDRACYYCGIRSSLEIHHLLQGRNRANSDKWGLMITLCSKHHTDQNRFSAHNSPEMNMKYKRLGQRCFEGRGHTREEFIEIFGKSYY